MTLSTGWTTACSPVTLGSSNGWDTNFDNVTYRGTPDTTPLVISQVQATPMSTTATITWTTNRPADSQVEYGTMLPYSSATPVNPTPVTAHSVQLTGLRPSTLYHYRVTSREGAGTPVVSPDATFTTAATAPNVATFDDLFPTERFLNGQYPTGQIDWGTNQWWLSGPWGLFTTNSISLPSASVTSASFTFLVPRILLSVDIYNGGTTSSTVTISCAGNPTRTQLLAAGQVMTLSTGWTTACSPVTLGSSNGWDTNFDNVTYRGTP
jgi:hypothetical protein